MATHELFVFNPQFDVPGFVTAASPMLKGLPPNASISDKLIALLKAPHPQAQEAAKKLFCFTLADPRNANAVRERGLAGELAALIEHPALGPVAATALDGAAAVEANRPALVPLAPRLLVCLRPGAPARSVAAGAGIVASLASTPATRDAIVKAGGFTAVVAAAKAIKRPASGSEEASAVRGCVVALSKAIQAGALKAVTDAHGVELLLSLARTPSSHVVDDSLAVLLAMTTSPQGREAIVAANGHVQLGEVLGETDSAATLQRALKTLNNVCVDEHGVAAVRSSPEIFEHAFDLMSALPHDSPLLGFVAHFLSNSLRSGVSQIVRKTGAIETTVLLFKQAKDVALKESLATILSNLLCETENIDNCIEEGVPKLFVSQLAPANAPQIILEVLRGVVNGTNFYEPFRSAIIDAGGLKALQGLLNPQVTEEIRVCVFMAFRNLALSCDRAHAFKDRSLITDFNKALGLNSLEIKKSCLLLLANLSMHDVVRPMVIRIITAQQVITLLGAQDRGLRSAALKVLTNFTHEGRVRKWIAEHPSEHALLDRCAGQDAELQAVLQQVTGNLKFGFDKEYSPETDDGVDTKAILAKLDVKKQPPPPVAKTMSIIAAAAPGEDRERLKREAEEQKREEEEKRKQREAEQKRALEQARLEMDLARERAEKEERKRREEEERLKQEAAARKAAEEKQRQEEETKRIAAEKARREAEAAAKKREEEALAEIQRLAREKREQEAEKLRREQEQRKREQEQREREAKLAEQQRLEEERLRIEEEERQRKKAEREEQRRIHQEQKRLERLKAEQEENARRIAEEEAKMRVLEEERRLAEEQARKEEEALRKHEEEERKAAEAAALAAAQARTKQEEEARVRAEAEAIAKKKADADAEAKRKVALRRTYIVREIYDTEKTFIDGIRHIILNYLRPLSEVAGTKSEIIPRAAIKAMFSNLEVIANFNSVLLDKLGNRLQNWSETQLIGDVFLSVVAYLRSYVEYVNNYENATTTLSKLRKENLLFQQFMETNEKAKPELALNSVLIFPVQRVPRYILLLADLLKHTVADHPDHQNLSKALAEMKTTGDFINERKRDAENISKLSEVQAQLRGKFPTLITPNRRYIADGPFILYKHPSSSGKHAHFFLFNDMLTIARPTGKGKFKWKGAILLEKVVVMSHVGDMKHSERCMRLQNPSPAKDERAIWTMMLADSAERDKWVSSIGVCKEDVAKKRASLLK